MKQSLAFDYKIGDRAKEMHQKNWTKNPFRKAQSSFLIIPSVVTLKINALTYYTSLGSAEYKVWDLINGTQNDGISQAISIIVLDDNYSIVGMQILRW